MRTIPRILRPYVFRTAYCTKRIRTSAEIASTKFDVVAERFWRDCLFPAVIVNPSGKIDVPNVGIIEDDGGVNFGIVIIPDRRRSIEDLKMPGIGRDLTTGRRAASLSFRTEVRTPMPINIL